MKHFTIKLSLALLFLTSFAINGKSQIYGTNTVLSLNSNTTTVVDPGITITETSNITCVNVQVMNGYVSGGSGDILGYTGSLPSGITASFDNARGILNFVGTTTPSNWQTLLRTVTLRTVNATCYASKRSVTFTLGNAYFNPANEHYYRTEISGSWSTVKAAAAASDFYGRTGYLATITSLDENNFIYSIVAPNTYPYLGGSDDYTEINAATGATTYANQASSDGNFYWVTGPEKGTHFSTNNAFQGGGATAVSGRFISWLSGQPDDWPTSNNSAPGEENYLQMYANVADWNDNDGTNSLTSVVEYGDLPSDGAVSVGHTTRNVLINGAPTGTISGDVFVCTGSNTATITIAPTGSFSVVRWESSEDAYFSNPSTISNTTTTLNLSGLTSNGYYRAIINRTSPTCNGLATSYSKVTLNSSTGTWTGTTNANWNTSGNWCGGVPSLTTDVLIPLGTPFVPSTNGTSQCKDLKVKSGTYLSVTNGNRLEIAGTTLSLGSIDATGSGDEVRYRGGVGQKIIANSFIGNEIGDLTIENSNGVTLEGNLLVTSTLDFNSGLLNTSASNLLSIDDGANNISGASSTTYVNGPLRKIGNDDPFVFQIGKSGKYAPCAIDNLSSNSNSQYFTAEYFKNPLNPYNLSGLGKVSGKEMWNITRSGSSSVSLTLYSYDSLFSGIKPNRRTTSDLVVAHWNSGSNFWEDLGGSRAISTSGQLTMVTMNNVNSFSPFTFGSPSGLNPLPVSLINFVAIPNAASKTVALNWQTASEENSKYFEVMHSTDFIHWTSIGQVMSQGNSNQMNAYTFTHNNPSAVNHYKLKEVSMNGEYKFSEIRVARFTEITGTVSIYPNPSTGSITVNNAGDDCNYTITDLTGKTIRTGNFNQSVQIDNLPKGVYIIKVVTEGFTQNNKIVIQ